MISQDPTPGAAPAPDPMIGRIIDGRYRVLSLIATGGMGRVYKAEQTNLGRFVALKVLAVPEAARQRDPHFRERFIREAAAISRLSHPHTVTIFDFGRTEDDIYFIVMEYVEGIPLSRMLKREKRLSPPRALSIAGQVCQALREAHNAGIVHRDIKPANILLKEQDQVWAKVLDFGIARFTSDDDQGTELTRVGAFLGTPEYMAPESFHGTADARADLYSLGVVLYVMLTGRVPFQGNTEVSTAIKVVQEPVPPIDPALEVPPEVVAIVNRCLEKDPEKRFQSALQLFNSIVMALRRVDAEAGALISMTLDEGDIDLRLMLEDEVADRSTKVLPAITGSTIAPRTSAAPRRWPLAVAAGLLLAGLAGGTWWAGRSPAPLEPAPLEPVSEPAPVDAANTSTGAPAAPLPSPTAANPGSSPGTDAEAAAVVSRPPTGPPPRETRPSASTERQDASRAAAERSEPRAAGAPARPSRREQTTGNGPGEGAGSPTKSGDKGSSRPAGLPGDYQSPPDLSAPGEYKPSPY